MGGGGSGTQRTHAAGSGKKGESGFAMKIAVIGGCGYVGLITAVGFARLGHDVAAVDVDERKVALLSSGRSLIYEEGLEEALGACLEAGRLAFTTGLEDAVRGAQAVFIAVGSPQLEDGGADLGQVRTVAHLLADALDQYTVLAIKSTAPPGTVDLMREILHAKRAEGVHADIVVNPEFLREGKGLEDFFFPTRIVIGTDSEHAREVMRDLYADFIADAPLDGVEMARGVPYLETSAVNAQMIKYASNAFLAARVSFVNELAGICEQVGADVLDVVHGMGYDSRIGRDYFQPGIGFGGPCLEKDLRALIHFAGQRGYQPSFMQAVMARNDFQVQQTVARTMDLLGSPAAGRRVAVLGLAFKPGANDVRTSLSLRIIRQLQDLGADVVAHDPLAMEEARELMPLVAYADDPYAAVEGADVALLLTDWPEYRAIDFERFGAAMKSRKMVDGRNLFDTAILTAHGFEWRGVGRTAAAAGA